LAYRRHVHAARQGPPALPCSNSAMFLLPPRPRCQATLSCAAMRQQRFRACLPHARPKNAPTQQGANPAGRRHRKAPTHQGANPAGRKSSRAPTQHGCQSRAGVHVGISRGSRSRPSACRPQTSTPLQVKAFPRRGARPPAHTTKCSLRLKPAPPNASGPPTNAAKRSQGLRSAGSRQPACRRCARRRLCVTVHRGHQHAPRHRPGHCEAAGGVPRQRGRWLRHAGA